MGETNSDVPCLHRSESHELHFLSPKQTTRKIIGMNSGSILLIYEFNFILLLDLLPGGGVAQPIMVSLERIQFSIK